MTRAILIFGLLSAAALPTGCNSRTSESTAIAVAEQAPTPGRPQLRKQLEVEASPPSKGEPVSLEGGGNFICARRHESGLACAGNVARRTERVDVGGEEKPDPYAGSGIQPVDTGYFDEPREVDFPLRDITGGYTWAHGLSPDNRVISWSVIGTSTELRVIEGLKPTAAYAANGLVCGVAGSEVECRWGGPCDSEVYAPLVVAVNFRAEVRSLVTGPQACAALTDGTVHCWGHDGPDGAKTCSLDRPTPVEGITTAVQLASDAAGAVCALLADNTVVCWGNNFRHGLGRDSEKLKFSATLLPMPELDGTVDLASGSGGMGALKFDGSVYFWGYPVLPWQTGKFRPQKGELPLPAIEILVGEYGVCALLTDRSIHCVGGRFDRGRKEKGKHFRTPFEGKEPWLNAPKYRFSDGNEIVHGEPPLKPKPAAGESKPAE